MEHYGHYAFYTGHNEEQSLLGNNGDQLDQASYYYLVANPDPGTLRHSPAPHSLSTFEDEYHDAYPLVDAGSLTIVDVPALQRVDPNDISETNDRHLDLDSSGVFDTNDSGYLTSTQPAHPDPSNTHDVGQIFDFQFSGLQSSIHYFPPPLMPPGSPTSGTHDEDAFESFQSEAVPLQDRSSGKTGRVVVERKRSRTTGALEDSSSGELPDRSAKFARTDTHPQRQKPNARRFPRVGAPQSDTRSSRSGNTRFFGHALPLHIAPGKLTKTQKMFIRKWKENFANQEPTHFLANEHINALATLVQAPPQLILDYIQRRFVTTVITQPLNSFNALGSQPVTGQLPEVSFAVSNQHLSEQSCEAVRKYVLSCHRRRPLNDRRRKVNVGHFRCTYGCGYRTARPFDWKRHEETHEPQKLWLCHLCRENGDQNPFLVNRRDKFLGHAKSMHKDWDPENVFRLSELRFQANFDRQCPFCTETCDTWDDRCKHIITHYEDDEIQGNSEEASELPMVEKTETTSDEDGSNPGDQSESTESSDDDESDRDASNPDFQKRDPTGGSGGGSGTSSGPPAAYRESGTGQGGEHSKQDNSYGSFSNIHISAITRNASAEHDPSSASRLEGSRGLEITKAVLHRKLTSANAFSRTSSSDFKKRASPSTCPRQFSSQRRLGQTFVSLGHGSHGCVDTVQEYISGRVYARKRSQHSAFVREIEILKRLHHPHVVRFVAVYSQNSSLNLVMSPIAQLTLQDFFLRPNAPENDMSRTNAWIGCLSSAISYIHSQNIRHADVKPGNILLRGSEVFVTDFGISRVVSETDSTSSSVSPSTPLYAPLEIAEHRPHGRKADIFSLGCVVLELLSFMQGKGYEDLHRHLGFTKRKRHASRDRLAYYRVQDRLLSWISMMRKCANLTTRTLWDICECMIQNKISLRPSANLLLERVRQALQEGSVAACQACTFGPSRIEELDSTDLDGGSISSSTSPSHIDKSYERSATSMSYTCGNMASSSQAPLLDADTEEKSTLEKQEEPRVISSNVCLVSTKPTPAARVPCMCACVYKRKRLLGLFDILAEYEYPTLSVELPNLVTDVFACQLPPPAYYDSSLYPVSLSGPTGPNQPQALVHVADDTVRCPYTRIQAPLTHMQHALGKVGMKQRHASRPPSALAQTLCHKCGRGFVAPCLDSCRGCSHIRCNLCTSVRGVPNSRVDKDLAGIGGHLLPPAYTYQDIDGGTSNGDPLTELQTESTVLNLVVADQPSLGRNIGERFIEDRSSTFDRIHSRAQSSSSNITSRTSSQRPPTSSTVCSRPPQQDLDYDSSTSASSLSANPQSKRAKLESHRRVRLNHRNNRQFISARSKQSVHIKSRPQAMNDHTTTNKLDSQDLTSRLQRIQKSNSTPNDGDYISRITRTGTDGTTSSHDSVFSRLPAFRKSKTSPTVGSNEVSCLEVVRTIPTSTIYRESAEVEQGEFSKPSIRRRRASNESSKSHKEFQYYGRHANSWLFNDFSISDHVKKGWGKVFSSKSDGEE